MSFQTNLQKTTEKGSNIPFNSNVTTMLFALTGGVYFLNASYQYWFTKTPDTNEIITTVVLGVMFVAIGFSFRDYKESK
jgi:Kef-type K+ transport system membrane component KefB